MKLITTTIAVLLVGIVFGCTHHTIKVDQDKPLRVDVKMRIDIYDHVINHADMIEDMVNKSDKPQSFIMDKILDLLPDFSSTVYAQEEKNNILSHEMLAVIESRKNRRDTIIKWQAQGIIGENMMGRLEIVEPEKLTLSEKDELHQLVIDENKDRMVIYQDIARIEGTSAEDVARVYTSKLYNNAVEGTPIQVRDSDSGLNVWKIK